MNLFKLAIYFNPKSRAQHRQAIRVRFANSVLEFMPVDWRYGSVSDQTDANRHRERKQTGRRKREKEREI